MKTKLKTRPANLVGVLLLSIVSIFAQAKAIRTSQAPEYGFVGTGVLRERMPHCVFTIIRHGLLLTAKHCFERPRAMGFDVQAKEISVHFASGLVIPSSAIQLIIEDRGDNDIAWMTYDPSASQGKIDLPVLTFATTLLEKTQLFDMPGAALDREKNQLLMQSKSCSLTGKSGRFPSTPQTSNYHGDFFEIDCPAWDGQSGSPLVVVKSPGHMEILGVLTHTFELLEDGNVDPARIETDGIGSFTQKSVFSPIYLQRSLP